MSSTSNAKSEFLDVHAVQHELRCGESVAYRVLRKFGSRIAGTNLLRMRRSRLNDLLNDSALGVSANE